MRRYRKVPDHVLTLLPRSLLRKIPIHQQTPSEPFDLVESNYIYSGNFDASVNVRYDYFYSSEADMVVQRWREVLRDSKALDIFEKRQLAIASEIMNVS